MLACISVCMNSQCCAWICLCMGYVCMSNGLDLFLFWGHSYEVQPTTMNHCLIYSCMAFNCQGCLHDHNYTIQTVCLFLTYLHSPHHHHTCMHLCMIVIMPIKQLYKVAYYYSKVWDICPANTVNEKVSNPVQKDQITPRVMSSHECPSKVTIALCSHTLGCRY